MGTASRSPGWSELVVFCGGRRWDGAGLMGRHVAAGLAEHVPVLYVDPVPVAATGTGDQPPVRIVGPRLAHLTPRVAPGGTWPRSGPVVAALARRCLRQAVAELGSPRVRAVIVSSLDPWFGACNEERRVVYVADDFLAGADIARLSGHRLDREVRRCLAGADLVLAASPRLAELFRAEGFDPVVLPDGCDHGVTVDHELPADIERLDGPVAGFVGDLAGGLDLDAIDEVAGRGHRIVLVGRGPIGPVSPALRSLLQRPNVVWIGPRSQEALPAYVARIDVGLAPVLDTPYGRARLPLDLLGHLQVGRPVVGTDCEALRWLRTSAGADELVLDDDLAIGATASELADLVDLALAAPPDPVAEVRRMTFARRHRWSERCARLAEVLEVGPASERGTGAVVADGAAAGDDALEVVR